MLELPDLSTKPWDGRMPIRRGLRKTARESKDAVDANHDAYDRMHDLAETQRGQSRDAASTTRQHLPDNNRPR